MITRFGRIGLGVRDLWGVVEIAFVADYEATTCGVSLSQEGDNYLNYVVIDLGGLGRGEELRHAARPIWLGSRQGSRVSD